MKTFYYYTSSKESERKIGQVIADTEKSKVLSVDAVWSRRLDVSEVTSNTNNSALKIYMKPTHTGTRWHFLHFFPSFTPSASTQIRDILFISFP